MASFNEIRLAVTYALHSNYKITDSFIEENKIYKFGDDRISFELGLYYVDDDSHAGIVTGIIKNSKYFTSIAVYYRDPTYFGGKYDVRVSEKSSVEKVFQSRQIYIACKKDKTKWRVDVQQTPDWKYDIDEWNSYFKDVFDSNWDNVGKYYYEVKSFLPFKLGNRTLRSDDSGMRWVILKDGMLMNLENHRDKAEFDDTVTLQGIPIMFIMLHMLPRVTKFQSKADIIQKLKDRIGNKYTKSVIVMQDNGDLRKYTFTACHVYWGAKELTVDEIDWLILRNHNAWNGYSLKRLPE